MRRTIELAISDGLLIHGALRVWWDTAQSHRRNRDSVGVLIPVLPYGHYSTPETLFDGFSH
jgi:hypothetical protein